MADRQCVRCGTARCESEFYTHGSRRSRICKPCERLSARGRHARNPEAHRAYQRAYETTNPERARAAKRAWYLANRAAILERHRARKRQRADGIRRYTAEYRRTHREARADYKSLRRALIAGARVGPVSRRAIIERDDSTCYLCGRRLAPREVTLDHVIPLARGGAHSAENLRVACAPCNSRKHARLPVAV